MILLCPARFVSTQRELPTTRRWRRQKNRFQSSKAKKKKKSDFFLRRQLLSFKPVSKIEFPARIFFQYRFLKVCRYSFLQFETAIRLIDSRKSFLEFRFDTFCRAVDDPLRAPADVVMKRWRQNIAFLLRKKCRFFEPVPFRARIETGSLEHPAATTCCRVAKLNQLQLDLCFITTGCKWKLSTAPDFWAMFFFERDQSRRL